MRPRLLLTPSSILRVLFGSSWTRYYPSWLRAKERNFTISCWRPRRAFVISCITSLSSRSSFDTSLPQLTCHGRRLLLSSAPSGAPSNGFRGEALTLGADEVISLLNQAKYL